jgi:hypothetical protein
MGVNIFKTLTKPSSNSIAALEQIKRLETHSLIRMAAAIIIISIAVIPNS